MKSGSEPRSSRRRWRWWAVVLLNAAGLLLIIPLLKITIPLMEVWWNTRSQASLRQHEKALQGQRPSGSSSSSLSTGEVVQAAPALLALTNQLGAVQNVSDSDLQLMVAQQFGFGKRNRPSTNSTQFDMDSAVFDQITRTTFVYRGTTYYGYEINLVDENGRHKTNVDCFEEPNLEYERSMATMRLIHSSPQLERVYRAMAGSLAAKASSSTNDPKEASEKGPELRLDPGAPRHE